MRRLFFVIVLFTICFAFCACGLQKVSPDPVILNDASFGLMPDVPNDGIPYLVLAESADLSDLVQTHTYQYYEYDAQGKLIRIYAPEGLLACLSNAPQIWDLYNHGAVREIEETYEYDRDHLIKLIGYKPAEIADGDLVSYEIGFEYVDDVLVGETLKTENQEYHVTLEYENSKLIRVLSSNIGEVKYLYDEADRISKKTIIDAAGSTHSVTYDYADCTPLYSEYYSADDIKTSIVDGLEVRITCADEDPYQEIRDYDLEGRILYISREYENGTVKYSNFYYSPVV